MADLSQSQGHTPIHFGKYLLDREIARGGMSRVFRARLRGPGGFEKKLVVKQILPELARDPSFIELFVKEANTLVQMSHPSLVPVYELGVVDGVYFLAMEHIEGATISELLQEGPLPIAQVAQIGAEIAEALRYAHERFQIVHRDVTPRNVIVDGAGHARLLDFGIAAPVALTGQGELFGSPGYMAPEQLGGEALGPESDLFSLGAVLHEAVSGKPALPRHTKKAQLPYAAVPPLQDTDAQLASLIGRCLQPARNERPSSAAEVASTLRTWLAEHHPRGVERELAERAQRAHDARLHAPRLAEPGTEVPSDERISGPIEVRSIATSPVLDELLKHATERIERDDVAALRAEQIRSDEEDFMNDAEAHATARRFLRDIVVVTLALTVAVFWAQHRPLHPAPEPIAATERALPTPVQPTSGTAPTSLPPSAAPAPEPSLPTVAPPPTAQDPAPIEPAKSGSITINAVPWAEVRIDGRVLGVTPRRNVPLRAGKHTLTFDCPPLGRNAKVPIEIKPGQALQVLANMQTDPAQISVR